MKVIADFSPSKSYDNARTCVCTLSDCDNYSDHPGIASSGSRPLLRLLGDYVFQVDAARGQILADFVDGVFKKFTT